MTQKNDATDSKKTTRYDQNWMEKRKNEPRDVQKEMTKNEHQHDHDPNAKRAVDFANVVADDDVVVAVVVVVVGKNGRDGVEETINLLLQAHSRNDEH